MSDVRLVELSEEDVERLRGLAFSTELPHEEIGFLRRLANRYSDGITVEEAYELLSAGGGTELLAKLRHFTREEP